MTVKLVVLRPFGGFKRGDAITDAAVIARILGTEQAASVVRVAEGEG